MIEDDARLAAMVRQYLEQSGFTVSVAGDGHGGLAQLTNPAKGEPVDLVFALFAPRDAGVEHLKALALVSRTLREPGICGKLRQNEDPDKLFAILTARPDIKAA